MWKKQLLDSITGLDELTNLEYLSLDGTEVTSKDITPVTKLTKLKNLEVGYWWTKDDLNLLYHSLPNLKYGSVKEAIETGEYEKYLRNIE
jgi:Leucine-rich repeat (LRR) protein